MATKKSTDIATAKPEVDVHALSRALNSASLCLMALEELADSDSHSQASRETFSMSVRALATHAGELVDHAQTLIGESIGEGFSALRLQSGGRVEA